MPEDDDATNPKSPDGEQEPAQFIAPPEDDATTLLAPVVAPEYGVIGDFEIHAKLGAGGMGAVYRARQVSLGRMVALKVLPQHAMDDPDSVARFQREARVAASLAHGNLVKVYSAGEADGCHYIAMELIEGQDLGQRIRREKKLPIPEALRIVADVARGLQHGWKNAHIVHRDIKPGNIFLSSAGEVKLGDLGLAKSALGSTTSGITQTGTMMGTPYYISPEQARADKELDFRADIYSLGCTLYHMLTGEVPYKGTEAITIIRQHLDAPLPAIMKVLPQCPIPLARLVGKMLKKSRHERHGSYDELIMQIESVWAQIDPLSYHPEAFAPALPPDPDATLLQSDAIDTGTLTPRTATPRVATASVASAPPAKARSKLPLYAGIAAGVIALGVISALVWPKGEEKLTMAQIAMKEREEAEAKAKAAAAKATPSTAEIPPLSRSVTSRWRVVDFSNLDPAAATQGRKNAELKDGALFLKSLEGWRLPDFQARNLIARTVVRWEQGRTDFKIRVRGQEGSQTKADSLWGHLKQSPPAFGYTRDTKGEPTLQNFTLPSPFEDGRDVTFEIAVVGSQAFLRVDGRLLGPSDNVPITAAGGVSLQAVHVLVKKLEVISLDHLSEADALKFIEKVPSGDGPSGEWQNLLANFDPEKVARNGVWKMQDGALFCTKRIPWSACELPFEDPGLNYDLRYRITRGPGSRLATFLPFRRGDTGGTVILDYYNEGYGDNLRRAGLENIKDTKFTDNGLTAKRPMFLPEGQETTVLVQVREKSLAVRVGDEEIFRWNADWSQLAQGRGVDGGVFQHLPRGQTFGVGVFDSQMTFHAIELRQVRESSPLVPSSSAPKAESASPAASGRWEDLLADSEVQNRIKKSGNTIVLDRVVTVPRETQGAVRVQTAFTPDAWRLRLIASKDDVRFYQAFVNADGRNADIQTVNLVEGKYIGLPDSRQSPLARPLALNEPYQCELRVTGDTVTFSINGQVVKEGRPIGLAGKRWGAANHQVPVNIQTLEYLSPGKSSPAPTGSWMNGMDDPCWNVGSDIRERTAEGWLLTKARIWILKNGPAGRDGAVRLRHRFTDQNGWPHPAVRIANDNWYFIALDADHKGIRISRKDGANFTILTRGSLPAPLRPGENVEAELRVAGSRLTARINGAVVAEVEDSVLTDGGFGMWANSRNPIPLLNIESLDLGATIGQ